MTEEHEHNAQPLPAPQNREEQLQAIIARAAQRTGEGRMQWQPGLYGESYVTRPGRTVITLTRMSSQTSLHIADTGGGEIAVLHEDDQNPSPQLRRLYQEAKNSANRRNERLEELLETLNELHETAGQPPEAAAGQAEPPSRQEAPTPRPGLFARLMRRQPARR